MARIRSIHPAIFADEAFMTLTVEAPLAIPLLLGIWAESDDGGIFEWKPLTLKAKALPAIGASEITVLLGALVENNFIRCFELDGRKLGAVRNFVRFQRPKKPKLVLPFTPDIGRYVGYNPDGSRPNAGTGRPSDDDEAEPVPNSGETSSELSPQMKEEGGRMKESLQPVRIDQGRVESLQVGRGAQGRGARR